jgi:hypothetical protein
MLSRLFRKARFAATLACQEHASPNQGRSKQQRRGVYLYTPPAHRLSEQASFQAGP